MWQIFSNLQQSIESYIVSIDSILYCIYIYFSTTITYYIDYNYASLLTRNWGANLLLHWFHPWRLDNLYNCQIADQPAQLWLWKNGYFEDWIMWYSYNFFLLLEKNYCIIAAYLVSVKYTPITYYLDAYWIFFIIEACKFSMIFIFILNFFFFTRTTLRRSAWFHNVISSKFFIFLESEEELGSVDDTLLFISFLLSLFGWYFFSTFFFCSSFSAGFNFISFGFITITCFVLFIPFTTLIDFGLAFASYVRGAGSSTNVFVEVIFDLIGTLVVFTRFFVQNIRFVLVFWAYFELFEWIYNSSLIIFFNNMFSLTDLNNLPYKPTTLTFSLYHFSLIVSGFIGYFYYFSHLLILLFIQFGAYFLISFWLFFFFYTAFYLSKPEKLFFYKRYYLN